MPDSQQQVRWAHAVLEGSAQGDKAFAKEVVSKMHGRHMSELPKRKGSSRGKEYVMGKKKGQ